MGTTTGEGEGGDHGDGEGEGAGARSGEPTPVHFDVDPGTDDAVMLAMALGLPGVEVVGVSTVCGNAPVGATTRNARSILALGDRADVPVARGCGRPLVDDLETAEWVHGEGGIRGELPPPEEGPALRPEHGADFLIAQAREYGPELVIAAVGPLPNLAIALAKEPDLPEMVDAIYLMGGAATGPGNATPQAEANFHNDPHAAARVLQAADPVMVGLDATTDATVTHDTVRKYRAAGGALGTVGAWLDYPEEVLGYTGGLPAIHDAAVVADLAGDVLDTERYPASVDTSGGASHGAVVCDVYGVTDAAPNCTVATGIDTGRFRELLREGVEAYAGGGSGTGSGSGPESEFGAESESGAESETG